VVAAVGPALGWEDLEGLLEGGKVRDAVGRKVRLAEGLQVLLFVGADEGGEVGLLEGWPLLGFREGAVVTGLIEGEAVLLEDGEAVDGRKDGGAVRFDEGGDVGLLEGRPLLVFREGAVVTGLIEGEAVLLEDGEAVVGRKDGGAVRFDEGATEGALEGSRNVGLAVGGGLKGII
jgi:hypothetical protein